VGFENMGGQLKELNTPIYIGINVFVGRIKSFYEGEINFY